MTYRRFVVVWTETPVGPVPLFLFPEVATALGYTEGSNLADIAAGFEAMAANKRHIERELKRSKEAQ